MFRHLQKSAVLVGCAVGLWAAPGCSSSNEAPPSGGAGTPGTPAAGSGGQSAAGNGSTPAAGSSSKPAAGSGGSPAASSGNAGAGGSPSESDANVTIARGMLAADDAPNVPDAEYGTFIAQVNDFGLKLGKTVLGDSMFSESNVVYSPLSVSMALAMTYAGANGSTASELKSVLGDSFAAGAFHSAQNRLRRELASRVTSHEYSGVTRKVELNVANSLWVERTLALEPSFLDLLGLEYDSGVRQVDFVAKYEPARLSINQWVSDQTKTKIQDLIPMGAIKADTRVVLVNALYFYGSWAQPFEKEATSDAPFQPLSGAAVQVPTMHAQSSFAYHAASDFAVAELPYESIQLRMTIVLPAAGQFAAVRDRVSAAWLTEATSALTRTSLEVALPKFKMTTGTISLKPGLESLGIKTLFSNAADLSGITKQTALVIDDVLQKAFIAVDEAGTEAAAATAVIARATGAAVSQAKFTVDRPFLYFIRDANGAVLFYGQVTQPMN